LSAAVSKIVYQQNVASAPGGDILSNDYRVDIPFVTADTYSTTLDYIVSAQ
jgi:large repetitive protein